jgi:hypothetical protein
MSYSLPTPGLPSWFIVQAVRLESGLEAEELSMRLPKLKLNDIVEVIWADIVQDPTWQSEEGAAEALPTLCRSLGYYLNHTSKVLRISESLNCDMHQRSVQVLPLGTVLKVKKLKG